MGYNEKKYVVLDYHKFVCAENWAIIKVSSGALWYRLGTIIGDDICFYNDTCIFNEQGKKTWDKLVRQNIIKEGNR